MPKARVDKLLVARGLADTRSRAQALIMTGRVLVNDKPITKAGTQVPENADIRFKGGDPIPFVSRGGVKLNGALEAFGLDVGGMVAIDVGASTGGFTDCLLQRGARHVYAVDVGYGQLAWKLRQDDRVTSLERTNIRALDPALIRDPVDLAVADVSFISLDKVLPHVVPLLAHEAHAVVLIKPQFEVGKGQVGSGGVVRDQALRATTIQRVLDDAVALGFEVVMSQDSTLAGPKGNVEHVAWFRWRRDTTDVVA